MIPFARILNYGNMIAPPQNVIQVGISDRGQFILMENGDLYYCGYNAGGEAGNGTTTPVSDWTLVGSDIAKFYSGGRAVVVLKKDGTIWSSGNTSWYNNRTSDSFSTTLVEKTSWYTAALPVSSIANIVQVGTLIFVLSTTGVLYGAGSAAYRGSLGIGTTALYTLTQSAIGVRKVMTTGTDSIYISTDNRLYSSGWNDRGQHGTNNRVQVNTWGARASGIVDATIGGTNIMYYNGVRYNTCGYTPNYYGNTVQVMTGIPESTLPNVQPLYMTNTGDSSYAAMMIITPSYQKGIGADRGLGLGGSQTGAEYTPVNLDLKVPLSSIKDLVFGDGITTILTVDGEIYSTGHRYAFPNNAADVPVFTKVKTP